MLAFIIKILLKSDEHLGLVDALCSVGFRGPM